MSGKVGVAPGTTTLQLPSGETIALADWIDDKMWTTGQLSNAQTDTLELFNAGRSQQIIGGTRQMTAVDTNVPRSGTNGLPKDWGFLVYGWGIEIVRVIRAAGAQPVLADFSDPVSFRTFFELNRRIYTKYVYNGKMYSEGLMEDYPQGSGVSLFTTNATTEIANNGVPSPRDRVALILPVEEREELGYHMDITPVIALVIAQAASDGGANCTFADVRARKNGLIKRPVV